MAFSAEENAAIRETLLREARRCAVTLGLRKTSVEQLTEAAGISKGLFYKYFASKRWRRAKTCRPTSASRTCCSRPAAAYPRSVR